MTEVDKMGHSPMKIENQTYIYLFLFVLKGIQRQYDQFF